MKIFKNIIITLMLMSSLVFAKSVGTITSLKGSANIARGGAEIEAKLGTKLEEKDVLKTKEGSQAQIIFEDETVITVGNNSSFSVDEYLFEESKTPSAKFGLVNGAMRTITGKIGKMAPDRFSVKTKTATIGIRGTHFTIIAEADGNSKVFCTFGAISVSSNAQQSTVAQGFYVSVAPNGTKSEPAKFTPEQLNQAVSKNFETKEESKEKSSNSSAQTQNTTSSTSAQTQDEASSTSTQTQGISLARASLPQENNLDTITPMDVITPIEPTRIETMELALTDITAQTTTNTQAAIVDVIEETVTPVPTEPEPTPTEPVPTEPEPTPTEPVPTEPEPTPTPTEPEPTPTEPIPTEPEPTPAPTEPEPTPAPVYTFTSSGKTAAYRNNNTSYEQLYYNLPAVSSSSSIAAVSTTGFDTSSYIKITDYIDGSTWTFTPASTLSGSIAYGSFSGPFASIASTNANISNIAITTSVFSITNDDLSSSDLMSWGEWNTAFTYNESGVASSATFKGLWVGGESLTPESVIQSYSSTTPIVYDGVYKALIFSETAVATTSTGVASLSVDFGNDRASLTVGNLATFADMPISGNSFASPASHSTANGTFYGAEGKEAAGSFSIMTEQYVPVAEGVYQVKTTQTPQ